MPETDNAEISQTDGEGFRKGQGFKPSEGVPQAARKSLLTRFKEARISGKKVAAFAAAEVAAGAAVVAGGILARGGGNTNSEPASNSGPDSQIAQKIDLTPTATTPTGETIIPGTNVAIGKEPTSTPTEVSTVIPTPENPPENPLFARYDSLAGKIKTSEISSDVKSDLLKQIDTYKTIESVQDQLMKAYKLELGPDGTPALLYYSWPKVPGVNQESQMFVLKNQERIDGLRGKVDQLNSNFDGSKIKAGFDEVNKSLAQKSGAGDSRYVGISISPSEYLFLADPASAPEPVFTNVNGSQKAEVMAILQKYGPLRGNFEIVGTTGASKTDVLADKTVVSINFGMPMAAEHELGHAENILQAENNIPAASYIHIAVLAEKVLFDADTGRSWNSLENMGKNLSQAQKELPAWGGDSPLDRLMHNFANQDFPQGMFLDGISKYATDTSGAKITDDKYAELTKTRPADKKVFYDDLNGFLAGDKDLLDQLSANSQYFNMYISWIRENPQAYTNLAKKLSGIQFTNPSGHERSSYYSRDGVLFNNTIFAVKLMSGDAKALEYLNSLSATERGLLLLDSIGRLQMTDEEYFADMAKKITQKPESANFANAVAYFKGLREAFDQAKISITR